MKIKFFDVDTCELIYSTNINLGLYDRRFITDNMLEKKYEVCRFSENPGIERSYYIRKKEEK